MNAYVPLYLPIVWVVVATVVALILYRTSEALIEQTIPAPGQRKRVKLVGSVAIAALVFLALARFTPTQRLDEMMTDQTRVSRSALETEGRAVEALSHSAEDLAACTAITRASSPAMIELAKRLMEEYGPTAPETHQPRGSGEGFSRDELGTLGALLTRYIGDVPRQTRRHVLGTVDEAHPEEEFRIFRREDGHIGAERINPELTRSDTPMLLQ